MVKYILCCAGGGIRGKIISRFLQHLEENLTKSLHDKFDMFGGTSTGSLIVASLVYEKMTAEKINNELYSHENANKIMDKSFIDDILGVMQTKPKYTSDGLQEIIDFYMPDNPKMSSTDKNILITGFDMDKYKPVVFKSYNCKHDERVKDALCISTAAPSYYPTHKSENGIWGIDGGVFSNDATDCVYADALKIFGKDEDIRVLSIGTGYHHPENLGERSQGYGGIEWMTDGNLLELFFSAPQIAVNYKMKTFTEALGHKYVHVNGEIDNTSMDDTSKKNLKELEKIGDDWWDKFGNQVLELLK